MGNKDIQIVGDPNASAGAKTQAAAELKTTANLTKLFNNRSLVSLIILEAIENHQGQVTPGLVPLSVELPPLPDSLAEKLHAAKALFETNTTSDDKARQTFIRTLISIRADAIKQKCATTEIDSDIISHPIPTTANTTILSAALVGTWRSARRDYLFRADGTYINLDYIDQSAKFNWSISGNQLQENHPNQTYTLILIDSDYFVFTSGYNIFVYGRVEQSRGSP